MLRFAQAQPFQLEVLLAYNIPPPELRYVIRRYFYLIFAPRNVLDLSQFVLTTEAHPLRFPIEKAVASAPSPEISPTHDAPQRYGSLPAPSSGHNLANPRVLLPADTPRIESAVQRSSQHGSSDQSNAREQEEAGGRTLLVQKKRSL